MVVPWRTWYKRLVVLDTARRHVHSILKVIVGKPNDDRQHVSSTYYRVHDSTVSTARSAVHAWLFLSIISIDSTSDSLTLMIAVRWLSMRNHFHSHQ